jgi:hypothetical protein
MKNGSVGLRVVSSWSDGSGSRAMSSRSPFCQKQSAIARTRTIPEKMIRVRSSSRCSTSVIRSSKLADFSRATPFLSTPA